MTDTVYMARALQLAAEGLYTTQPNPRVGCVILKEGQVIGEGFHARAGQAHPEVHALKQAGAQAKGSTAYVTLEPCAHYGRTPPCANALIAAQVSRVVIAALDSNPLVAGKGQTMLEAAGISTTVGILEQQAIALNAGFFRRMAGGLPYVRVKTAASLDGRTAMQSGESKWITGSDARRDVQKWRAQSGVIITGIGTVLADNPSLTVRTEDWTDWHYGEVVQPKRVVLDSQLRMPLDAFILQTAGVIIVTLQPITHVKVQQLQALGVDVWCFDSSSSSKIDVLQVLKKLAEQGVNEVLVEAGASVAGAFVEANLVDEWVLYFAPTLLGSDARPMFDWPIQTMAQQQKLQICDMRMVGNDLRVLATSR